MLTALVVDDDPSIASMIGSWLAARGYEVVTSSDYPDATTKLKARPVAAVVVDVRLGEFNGLQIAERARRHQADVKVVVMSGWSDRVLEAEARRIGAVFLHKPFTMPELLAAIDPGDTPDDDGPKIH